VVPDNYFEPKARHNATLAASITFALVCIWVLASDFVRRAKAQLAAISQAPSEASIEDPSPRPGDNEEVHPRFVRNLRPKA
jgi:hypothetical protein